eukprot:EG_transcript_12051
MSLLQMRPFLFWWAVCGFLPATCTVLPPGRGPLPPAVAYLAETRPQGDFALPAVPGTRDTADVWEELLRRATRSVDLTAMYWNLRRYPEDAAAGSANGHRVYEALAAAAARGVRVRCLQAAPGAVGSDEELRQLQRRYPGTVAYRLWDGAAWYGQGVMHQKLWIVDGRHLYLGSANMDWLSLAQVKELGVAVFDSSDAAADLQQLFEDWWAWAAVDPAGRSTDAFDPAAQVARRVPCWSELVGPHAQCPNPLPAPAPVPAASARRPLRTALNGTPAALFFTAAPPEVRDASGRTFDEAGLRYTVLDAHKSVCLSVMDFLPGALYHNGNVWWPALWDALITAATTKALAVRVLVSRWAHTRPAIGRFLRPLLDTVAAHHERRGLASRGSLEVRWFVVPGWNATGPNATWPPYSRVNHAKYIVTDRRLNVGTSNMAWDYFHTTAGSSLNAAHPPLVAQAQAVFDRD